MIHAEGQLEATDQFKQAMLKGGQDFSAGGDAIEIEVMGSNAFRINVLAGKMAVMQTQVFYCHIGMKVRLDGVHTPIKLVSA